MSGLAIYHGALEIRLGKEVHVEAEAHRGWRGIIVSLSKRSRGIVLPRDCETRGPIISRFCRREPAHPPRDSSRRRSMDSAAEIYIGGLHEG